MGRATDSSACFVANGVSLEDRSRACAAIVESADAAVSVTRATERAVIAPQLGPRVSACHKWHVCLEIAAEDVRSSAQLV
jgi:hypothetical protein